MPSLQSRVLYGSMKLFYRRLFPPNLPIEKLRNSRTSSVGFERMPRNIRWEDRTIGGVPGEWIIPQGAASDHVLLYFHGGGYVFRSPTIHRPLVGRLARAIGSSAFMADYRLAPEHPFPAAVEDATAAYRGLLDQGFSPSRIVIAGDSAGGGLTVAMLVNLRDAGIPLPAAAALISGWVDCTVSGEAVQEYQERDPFLSIRDLKDWAKHYHGDHAPDHPLISPVFAELYGLPPLLIHAGDQEIILPESIRFAEKAKLAGTNVTFKVWNGMIHDFPLFAGFLPEGRAAIAEMGAFFRSHLIRQ